MDKIAYFDNAATTFPKPESVYTFMDDFYRKYGVNVGRGQHQLASKAALLVKNTRECVQNLMHAENKEVIFTHTATEAINVILMNICAYNDITIYTTPFEHNAVTRVLKYHTKRKNISVEILAFDKTALEYDVEAIKYQFITKKPNVVILNHVSNVFGFIAPIQDICALSKAHGAINVIDMCQSAGLIDVDLNSSNIDFAVFNGHKTLYGPFGIAGFICENASLLYPLILGGTGVDSLNQEMPVQLPERFEAGSHNIHAISGLNAALHWLHDTGIENVSHIEKKNHQKLLDILKRFKNIKLIGEKNVQLSAGIVSCVFKDLSCESVGNILDKQNVAVRTGLHCSPKAHEFMGTSPEGTVRFSVSFFNEDVDFEILESALEFIEESS